MAVARVVGGLFAVAGVPGAHEAGVDGGEDGHGGEGDGHDDRGGVGGVEAALGLAARPDEDVALADGEEAGGGGPGAEGGAVAPEGFLSVRVASAASVGVPAEP